MDVEEAIVPIVEHILSDRPKDKILHICVNLYYLCFPNDSNDIQHRTFLHYIFYGPNTYTRVLFKETSSPSLLDEQGKLFYQTAYHNDYWRQDGLLSIYGIHWGIVRSMERKYKSITNRSMTELERLKQPDSCSFRTELLNGRIITHPGNKNREYRLQIQNTKTTFVQVKKGESF